MLTATLPDLPVIERLAATLQPKQEVEGRILGEYEELTLTLTEFNRFDKDQAELLFVEYASRIEAGSPGKKVRGTVVKRDRSGWGGYLILGATSKDQPGSVILRRLYFADLPRKRRRPGD